VLAPYFKKYGILNFVTICKIPLHQNIGTLKFLFKSRFEKKFSVDKIGTGSLHSQETQGRYTCSIASLSRNADFWLEREVKYEEVGFA
jgi:hypothetical protein